MQVISAARCVGSQLVDTWEVKIALEVFLLFVGYMLAIVFIYPLTRQSKVNEIEVQFVETLLKVDIILIGNFLTIVYHNIIWFQIVVNKTTAMNELKDVQQI